MKILYIIFYERYSQKFAVYFLQIYDENELLQVKLDILSKTNMVDYAIDIRKQLYPNEEVPEVS
jgi:eIF3 subunit 6 N terminal domain.